MTHLTGHSPQIMDMMIANIDLAERQQVRFAETAKTPEAVAEAERGAGIYRRLRTSLQEDRNSLLQSATQSAT